MRLKHAVVSATREIYQIYIDDDLQLATAGNLPRFRAIIYPNLNLSTAYSDCIYLFEIFPKYLQSNARMAPAVILPASFRFIRSYIPHKNLYMT
jgi:hypothetical protein